MIFQVDTLCSFYCTLLFYFYLLYLLFYRYLSIYCCWNVFNSYDLCKYLYLLSICYAVILGGRIFYPRINELVERYFPEPFSKYLTEECPIVPVWYKQKGPFSTGNLTKFAQIIPFFGLENPKKCLSIFL